MTRIWLKELRQSKGMRQADVASASGISQAYYAEIEKGNRCGGNKCETEKAIAVALGFEWTRFFEDEE